MNRELDAEINSKEHLPCLIKLLDYIFLAVYIFAKYTLY